MSSAKLLKAEAADGWAATYGGPHNDRARSIQQTRDGGYIVAGWTESFGAGDADFWVLKLRPDGTVEWQKTYGGEDYDEANSILETSDGGYIVAGNTKSFGAGESNLWVLKLRPDGTVEWQKTYGGEDFDGANSIQKTSDGGYIVAGRTVPSGAGGEVILNFDFWVSKLRADGTVEWEKTYGGEDYDWADSVQQTRDGGYIVAGRTYSFGAGAYDFWVLKLRSNGTVEWQKTYGGDYDEWPYCIQQTGEGGYIMAGWTQSFGNGDADLWVLKLRPDGAMGWQKTYKGVSSDLAHSIQQTRDGGYIVAGGTESFGAGAYDFWVLKLRPDGTVEWQKTYGGDYDEWPYCIQQTGDGGYIVAGWTYSFGAGAFDLLVLKLRPDGSINPSCDFIGNTNTSGKNSNATILDTSVSARDSSSANIQASTATVRDTSVTSKFLVK